MIRPHKAFLGLPFQLTALSPPFSMSLARHLHQVNSRICQRGSLAFPVEEDNEMEIFIVFLAAITMTGGLLHVYDKL